MDLKEARRVTRQWMERELRRAAPAGSVGRLTGEAAHLAPPLAVEEAFDEASSATEALKILTKEFEERIGPMASKALEEESGGGERGLLGKIVLLSKPGSGAIAKALTSEFEKEKYAEAAKGAGETFVDILRSQESLPQWDVNAMPKFLDSYVAHKRGESNCTEEFGRKFAGAYAHSALSRLWEPREATRNCAANVLRLCFEGGLGARELLLKVFEEAKKPEREPKPSSSKEPDPQVVG